MFRYFIVYRGKNGNHQEILYNSEDMRLLKNRVKNSGLRLDPDEIN